MLDFFCCKFVIWTKWASSYCRGSIRKRLNHNNDYDRRSGIVLNIFRISFTFFTTNDWGFGNPLTWSDKLHPTKEFHFGQYSRLLTTLVPSSAIDTISGKFSWIIILSYRLSLVRLLLLVLQTCPIYFQLNEARESIFEIYAKYFQNWICESKFPRVLVFLFHYVISNFC